MEAEVLAKKSLEASEGSETNETAEAGMTEIETEETVTVETEGTPRDRPETLEAVGESPDETVYPILKATVLTTQSPLVTPSKTATRKETPTTVPGTRTTATTSRLNLSTREEQEGVFKQEEGEGKSKSQKRRWWWRWEG